MHPVNARTEVEPTVPIHVCPMHPQPVGLLLCRDGLAVTEHQQTAADVVALGVEVRRAVVVTPPEVERHGEVQPLLADKTLRHPQAFGNGNTRCLGFVVLLVDAAGLHAPLAHAFAVLRQVLGVRRHRPPLPWHETAHLDAVVVGMQHLLQHPAIDLPGHGLVQVGSLQVRLVSLGVLCHQLCVGLHQHQRDAVSQVAPAQR